MVLPRFAFAAFLLAAAAAVAADAAPKFTLASPDFKDGGKLPAEFTCDGERASPSLSWNDPPAGTKSFAVIMHHVPGPGDTHVYLVLYNIPSDIRSVQKNARNVGIFGLNTVNEKPEYTPPCSKGPGDKKYTMTVYALSADTLKFDKPVTRDMLLDAIKDKTLGTSEMTVTYARGGGGQEAGGHEGPGGGGAGGGNGDRQPPANGQRRGGPPELQRALEAMKLTPEQQTKVDAAMQGFREKQETARNDLLKQLKETLSAEQFEKIQNSFKRPGPPPPAGENH